MHSSHVVQFLINCDSGDLTGQRHRRPLFRTDAPTMSHGWIDERCREASSANPLAQRATSALSQALLSPIKLDNATHTTHTTSNHATPTTNTFTTDVEIKRQQLCDLMQSIRTLLSHIQSLLPTPPQQCIEAVRHASYLCSKLPSVDGQMEEDECLVLFQCIATFILPSTQPFNPSGWLHDDFLHVVPVHRFSMPDRLALCSCYPSVWRRYLRRLLAHAVRDFQNSQPQPPSPQQRQTAAAHCVSGIVPRRREDGERDGVQEYIACPLLHIVALHELQCLYVTMVNDLDCVFLTTVMTLLRQALEGILAVRRVSESSASAAVSLDVYMPNGVWLSDVTKCLVESCGNGVGNIQVQALPQVVEALNAAMQGTAPNDDGRANPQQRNAIWLYLLQWQEYVDAVRQHVVHGNRSGTQVAHDFLAYVGPVEEEVVVVVGGGEREEPKGGVP